MELTNRTILITGGSTGIGYALAKQFISNHNRVIICGRNQAKLDRAKAQLIHSLKPTSRLSDPPRIPEKTQGSE